MIDPARIALALSDPIRLRILDLMMEGRDSTCCSPDNPEIPNALCACDLRPQLDGIAPSKLGYHTTVLKEAGLIAETKRGRWVYFSLKGETLKEYLQTLEERYLKRTVCCLPDKGTPVELDDSLV